MGFVRLDQKMAAQERVVVVAYGDSWTYGSCADGWLEAREAGYDRALIHGSWVSQLSRLCKAHNSQSEVHNAGQGGWTGTQGVAGFETLVGSLRPDVVLLNFGINDWRHQAPITDYRRSIEELTDRIRLIGSDCLLWTSGPVSSLRGEDFGWGTPVDDRHFPHGFEAYNETLRDIASERGLLMADAERAIMADPGFVREGGTWFLDAYHLFQQGHDRIFQCIRDQLRLDA